VSEIETISRRVNHWIEYLLFGLGLSMAIVVAAQVFFRYALNQSLFWSEELARFLLVWLTFLGATVAYYRKAHPGVDLFYAKMGRFGRRLSRLVVYAASVALFGVMIYHGCRFAWFVRLQISPALQLPKWIVLSIVPVSGAVLMLHVMAFLRAEVSRTGRDN
jgi:TRAP-type C4-dicarboxylate transport system permease small subunit